MWKSGRVAEGGGLENRLTKVTWVRILPLPPIIQVCSKKQSDAHGEMAE